MENDYVKIEDIALFLKWLEVNALVLFPPTTGAVDLVLSYLVIKLLSAHLLLLLVNNVTMLNLKVPLQAFTDAHYHYKSSTSLQ